MGEVGAAALVEIVDMKLGGVGGGECDHGPASERITRVSDGVMTEGSNDNGERAPRFPWSRCSNGSGGEKEFRDRKMGTEDCRDALLNGVRSRVKVNLLEE